MSTTHLLEELVCLADPACFDILKSLTDGIPHTGRFHEVEHVLVFGGILQYYLRFSIDSKGDGPTSALELLDQLCGVVAKAGKAL